MSRPASPLRHLDAELAELDRKGLLRSSAAPAPQGILTLCSNDYLAFAGEPPEDQPPEDQPPEDGASEEGLPPPGGAGGSRLISGDHPEHHAVEERIARWLGQPAALMFTSGYAANVGTIAALAGPDDAIVSDVFNHASIIDGCRLSRAQVKIVPHLDLAAVEQALARSKPARRRLVITESYFSMDGDSPDLVELRRLSDAYDAALYVDEAHALGVFGSAGRGLCHQAGVLPDIQVGTFSKAVGLQGAFVAGSQRLRSWLWNRARSLVFSTGPSPWLARAIDQRLARVQAADDRRERLQQLVDRFRSELGRRGAPVSPSHGPIIPWLTGDSAAAVVASEALLDKGIWVRPIRPPTVPTGTARLRITLHAKLSDAQLESVLDALCGHLR